MELHCLACWYAFALAANTLSRVSNLAFVQIASALLFAIAGLVVKPERHRFLFGVRREDLFHVMIAAASVGIAIHAQ